MSAYSMQKIYVDLFGILGGLRTPPDHPCVRAWLIIRNTTNCSIKSGSLCFFG